MKALIVLVIVVLICSCRKTTDAPIRERTIGKMNSLSGSDWKVFRTSYLHASKYNRTDTSNWVQYVDFTDYRNDHAILFRQDSTYECDLEIALALMISTAGRYMPDRQGDFDSVTFVSSYFVQKAGVKKMYYPEHPFDYSVEIAAANEKKYFKGYGRVVLEQVN